MLPKFLYTSLDKRVRGPQSQRGCCPSRGLDIVMTDLAHTYCDKSLKAVYLWVFFNVFNVCVTISVYYLVTPISAYSVADGRILTGKLWIVKNLEEAVIVKSKCYLCVCLEDKGSIIQTWYCKDRVSSCNIYAVQQDTQSVLISEFIHQIQLVQNAPDDGPVRPETCRANIRDE